MFGLSQKEKNSVLYNAVVNGDAGAARRVLERGADPNFRVQNYGPILFRALNSSSEDATIDFLRAFVDNKVSLSGLDDYRRNALHYAIYRNSTHVQVVKALLNAGVDSDATDGYGATPLMTAISKKAFPSADLLLDYCKRDNKADALILTSAIAAGAPLTLLSRIMRKLTIDINAVDKREGTTALHAAVLAGDQKVLDWVLKVPNVKVNATNKRWQTPLHLAAAAGRAPMVQSLLKSGASADDADMDGNIALVTAARMNNQEIVEALIDAKAALGRADRQGMTALCAAAGQGSIRMVMALLAAGEKRGMTLELEPALFAAAERGHGRVLELLIKAGADVNAIDSEGRTPLMRAVQSDQVETLSILVNAGAKPDVRDRHGMYAYDHAVSGGRAKAKDYLGHFRDEPVKAIPGAVTAISEDSRYVRLNDFSLEVREGAGLTMTFNFWTQQVLIRDAERPSSPVTVQNFADVQRQAAIDEAYDRLRKLGGKPPDPRITTVHKAAPGKWRGPGADI